jgi:hypothetical protein
MTMTPALTAAAERLITLPGFRWMPGMVDVQGNRFVDVSEGIIEIDGELFQFSRGHYSAASPALPDLTDPATIGCVLAMVREAWKRPGIHVRVIRPIQPHKNKDTFYQAWDEFAGVLIEHADTEAECLVNTLAAAAGAK